MFEPVTRSGPAWRAVADDLRDQIAAGKLALGEAIPSTPQLMDAYGVSSTVVRHAVTQLRNEGLLVGHAGKGVYVTATPEQTQAAAADQAALAAQLEELRGMVARLEVNLMHLYDRLGQPYPHDQQTPNTDRTRRTGTGG